MKNFIEQKVIKITGVSSRKNAEEIYLYRNATMSYFDFYYKKLHSFRIVR